MNQLDQLPIPLLQWYRENARVLPWRSDPTPYHVWVSEIMLQQTRVAAVLDYYRRFMEALPTVADLAAVEEDRLMKLWQGLGYYSRARNLQKAARQIVDQFGGAFPSTYQDLRSLAGVGEYTAAAIASIAFGQPVPAVDGNLLRVAARVMGDDTDITTTQGKRHFTQALQEVIPTDFPGKFNQAMMDLGAMVCTRSKPKCELCPVNNLCVAYANHAWAQYPGKKPKQTLPERTGYMLLMQHGDGVFLAQRPPSGLWGGLYCFPQFEDEELLREWLKQRGIAADNLTQLTAFRHTFSHFHLDIVPMWLPVSSFASCMDEGTALWYNLAQPPSVGLAAPVERLLQQLRAGAMV